jgi:hypothetical protein
MRRLSPWLFAIAAAPAVGAIPEPPGLAPHLRAPAAEEAAFMLAGNGVHIYQCKAQATRPDAFAWFFVAPDVALSQAGTPAATHTAANQWDSARDPSSVSAVPVAAQAAGGDNLPWALMRARPAGEDGLFAGVTSIQRVRTAGGAAPATGCDAARVGEEVRVAFSAEYYFYKRRGAS